MISVIIPCYNSEAFVSRAIESLLVQNFTDWELIAVNNNSTDNTQKVLERYKDLYPAKIQIVQALKKGAAAARNKGLGVSKGNWVQYLDADDELLPGKLQRHIELAERETCEVIAGAYIKEVLNNKSTDRIQAIPFQESIWKGLISTKLGITSANFWKKTALSAVGGWNEELSSSQEYELLFRLMKTGYKVCIDKEPGAVIHATENSVSRGSNAARFQEITDNWLELRLKIRKYLQENNLYDQEMNSFFDKRVYMMLKWYERYTGSKFIDDRLKKLELQVSLIQKLKSNNRIKPIVNLLRRS